MTAETAGGTCEPEDGPDRPRPGVVSVFSGWSPAARTIPLGAEPTLLGREGPNAIEDERLSRSHCTIAVSAAGWRVRDLDSRNGTFVDGERVSGERLVPTLRVLRAGDTILLARGDLARYRPVVLEGGVVLGDAMQGALAQIDRAAAGSETLVLAGESGTGKELAAHRFHARGPGSGGPFLAINCATIPDGLAERLLFGAKKGAYSGATADVIGHVRAADGGVLFLDEGGELDLHVQAKLLRAIETGEVLPLGATRPSQVKVRICLASHVRLRRAVSEGRFRADLYHRLAPPEVLLPALRDRLDEIPHHVEAVLREVAPALRPRASLVEACMLRPWPGNVRELRKHLRDAATQALSEGADRVRSEHLSPSAGRPFEAASLDLPSKSREARPYVHRSAQLTKEAIEQALAKHSGNVSRAARSLGLQRTQLYREMERHGLARPAKLR